MIPLSRTLLAMVLGVGLIVVLGGCGSSETRSVAPNPDNPFFDHALGRDDAFEVVTWNLHNFATDSGEQEVELVADAILAMGVDVVALQEIKEESRFTALIERLPGWSGHQATSTSYDQDLGYVWVDSTVTVRTFAELRPAIEDLWRPFPRLPLVLEVTWQGVDLALINNHFKCCGDGELEVDDPGDEETRRLTASTVLEEHIAGAYQGSAVILLGDLNDRLDDPPAHDVFAPFRERPDLYRFADQAVAEGPQNGWSWGPGRSHLDHILVNAPLLAALDDPAASCGTLRIDFALAAGDFNALMSDHAPVVLVLPGASLPGWNGR